MKIHFPSVTLHLFLSCLLLICLPIQADTRDISIQSTDLFNQQNKVHIAIGISNYNTKNTGFGRLKYAAKDASLLSNTFRTKGYHPIRILDHNANKQTILNKIKRAGKLFPKGEGTLIFSFSGHGYKQGGRSYLATYDAYASNLRGTGLTVQEVVHTIRQTGVRRAILLLDACRNNPLPGQKSIGKSKALGGVNPGRGIQILYSTNQGNVSWEHKSIQQGVFSYFVNRALNGNVAKKNGAVTFNDLAQYVTREVPLWTDSRLSETQQPYRGTAGEFYGDFVMVSKKINTARVTPRPRPVVQQQNKQPRPQAVNHYHGQKNHVHVLPNNSIQHRHGQGMEGSHLAVKPQLSTPQAVTQPQTNRPIITPSNKQSSAGTASLETAIKQKDYTNAFRIATQLAQRGKSEGEFGLGRIHGRGLGVDVDNKKAFKWMYKAATQKHKGAEANLAFMYKYGIGVIKNIAQSEVWFNRAIKLNGRVDSESKRQALRIIDAGTNLRIAQINHSTAALNLSTMLIRDGATEKGFEVLLKEAIKSKNSTLQYFVGLKYRDGYGIARNLNQAKIWFQKASKQDHKKAKKELQKLE